MNTNYDVMIVGTGAAGLYTALNLAPTLRVLMISKKEMKLCNSALAQGGVAGVYHNPEDSPALHKKDTLIAGGYENRLETLDVLVNEACIDIDRVIKLGVEFDKKPDGDYHRTLEGGHGMHRIFHHEDTTGYEIVSKLQERVLELPNVSVLENAQMCDIQKTATGFALDILCGGKHETYLCHYTVFCTGGIGRVYEYTTNTAIATGDGIAMAYYLGAEIRHLSYIQFHPTAFQNHHTRECFLISEAVRGEGAYLRNCKRERFMQDYDERLELAPRDVVSHAIISEAKKTGSDEFYIDVTHLKPDFIKKRFPMIYSKLLEVGYDMTKDLVPIFPCQHYLMGGINVDTSARTSVAGLYACGECSHTGVHGNNRLASNSLLEALVFSRRAAQDINSLTGEKSGGDFTPYTFANTDSYPVIPTGLRTEIRKIMQTAYFVIPDAEKIRTGIVRIREIYDFLENGKFRKNHDYVEASSLATVAYIVLSEAQAALEPQHDSEQKQ